MALRKSTQAAARVNAPSALNASTAVVVFAEHITKTAEFAVNDVLEMIPWPAGTIPISIKASVADLDSNGTPLVTLDFGVLSGQYLAALDDAGAARTCSTAFATASTVGQAGGVIDVASNLMLGLAPVQYDRSIGFKVAAAAATLVVGAKIQVAAQFLPVPQGVAFA